MTPDEKIQYYIDFSKSNYKSIEKRKFIQVYEEIIDILKNGNEYTEKQKNKLKQEAFLESMAIMYDWLKNYTD